MNNSEESVEPYRSASQSRGVSEHAIKCLLELILPRNLLSSVDSRHLSPPLSSSLSYGFLSCLFA